MWHKPKDADYTELQIGPFTLQAYQRGERFDWEVIVQCQDYNPDAVVASGTGEHLDLEEAQGEAVNALNELLVEARGALDYHLERQWKEETGRAHADQR